MNKIIVCDHKRGLASRYWRMELPKKYGGKAISNKCFSFFKKGKNEKDVILIGS